LFCCINPDSTSLVSMPRRLKSTAAANSIALSLGSSDPPDGGSRDRRGSEAQ
jgi:hypothetical protein